LLDIKWEEEIEKQTKYKGKGRGGKNREIQVIEKKRYQITQVSINRQNVKERLSRSGWIVYVSNVNKPIITLSNCVLTYRENYHTSATLSNRLENNFHILKSSPLSISPLFVRNDLQIRGLTNLLMLALRVVEYTETVIRQQIEKRNEPLKETRQGFAKKFFHSITFATLLSFFADSNITLTTVSINKQIIKTQTDNLNNEHIKILEYLNIPIEKYTKIFRI